MASTIALEFLKDYRRKTDSLFSELLESKREEMGKIGRVPSHVVDAFIEIAKGGKRVRGALFVLGYMLSGQEPDERVWKASLAVELLQAGLLIQDDVMDEDVLRRGVQTLHTRFTPNHFGESVAMCMGDVAFGWAWEILMASGFPPGSVVEAGAQFGRSFYRTGYGQILDMANAQRGANVERRDVEQVLELKTGEYTGVLPLSVGAILGGVEGDTLERVKKLGMQLATAFQMRDDWLGVMGKTEDMGKQRGNDIREGKMTYLIIYTKEHASPEQWQVVGKVLGKQDAPEVEVESAIEVLQEVGAVSYIEERLQESLENGRRELWIIAKTNSQVANILDSLFEYVATRTS